MSISWQQRPIDHWPGELTKYRSRAPFKSGWQTTTQLLDRELRQLDAKAIVMLVALEPRDFRIDGQPRANARAQHPGVILTFDSKFGPLRYACDTFDDFTDNVRAIALGLEALRKVERYGITKRGEQYTGWSALPPGMAMGLPMSREDAARVLCDLAGPDWWDDGDDNAFRNSTQMLIENCGGEVEGAYRWAVKLHHPDAGGDPDLFRRATEARDVLAREAT
jgi:hypothetical protein